jgi:hypothetical protein
MSLEPAQPPIQWVLGAVSLGVKWSGCEADHSPPSSAEVKEKVELYLHYPNTPSWRDAQLKHRDNFTFTFKYDGIILDTDIDSSISYMKFLENFNKSEKFSVHLAVFFVVLL